MIARILWFLLALMMALCSAACAEVAQQAPAGAMTETSRVEQGFEPIFNGVDLKGWQVMGTESWSVADGAMTCSGEGGGWIRSEGQYRDFTLRLEYKISPGGNSGIFIRSTLLGNPAFTGMEIQVLDDHGNPPDTHSAGSLYDAVAPVVNASKPAGEWNDVEVSCWGDSLAVFMNGQKLYAIDLADPELNATQSDDRKFTNRAQFGYIGFQNHGQPVAYRNLRINEGFRPLLNGRDLDGWQVVDPNDTSWSVQDGLLTCSGEGGGWIRTDAQYRDFILRLEYRIAPEGNSGIFVRAPLEGAPWVAGMEIQVLDDHGNPPDTHSAGALYDVLAPAVNPSKPAGEWNQVEIACWGDNLLVIINDKKLYQISLADEALNAALPEDRKLTDRAKIGYIGLQNHGSPVAYRNIRVNDGFAPIFNGRDLEGWKTVDPNDTSWSAQDGVLVCDGGRGGYMYSVNQYGDFVLRIQYKIAPNGNSGVFFRIGDINDFPGSGAEIQVLDSYGGDPSPHGSGAVYGVLGPSKNTARPAEEWNQFEIACWEGRLTVVMNDETVIDVGMDEYAKLQSLPAEGHLGLQNHGSRVEYRDILVKTPSWAPFIAGAQQ
ncbi:MAG: DUF1080 domain-containing protein [Armatimonadota bacterium]|nr:MAG: DUF1080 domain-containing protein [Armatimonadota bacterium]